MSRLHEKLAAGKPAIGLAVHWSHPGIIEGIGWGYDFIWVDGQHGYWELDTFGEAARACDVVGAGALIRVADHTYGRIGKVLDLDPSGIIVPCVDTPEQARAIVDAANFPPVGNRSYGGRRVIDKHGRGYATDTALKPLVIAQIETPTAVANIEAIAALEGIDGLFFGPDDMKLRLGLDISLPPESPDVAHAARKVAAVANAHGKLAISVGGTSESLAFLLEAGYGVVALGADVSLLKRASAETLQWAGEVLARR